MSKKTRKLLKLVFILVFFLSTTLLVRNVVDSIRAEQDYADAQALSTTPGTAPSGEFRVEEFPEIPPPAVEDSDPQETQAVTYWVPVTVEDDPVMDQLMKRDLEALREKNPDVIGWIHIPKSKIDYPIVQGEDNEYYLERNWRGEKLSSGSIFLECQNGPDFTDYNTIIYGHKMANGSMFGSLTNYGNQAYSESHPYIYVRLDYGVLRYEVFSAYATTVGSKTYGLSFRQAETRTNYLQMAAELSEIETGITPELTDLLLTLSTCHGMGDNRWIVHARLPMTEYFPQ